MLWLKQTAESAVLYNHRNFIVDSLGWSQVVTVSKEECQYNSKQESSLHSPIPKYQQFILIIYSNSKVLNWNWSAKLLPEAGHLLLNCEELPECFVPEAQT